MNILKSLSQKQEAGTLTQQTVDSFAESLRSQLMTAANGTKDGRTIGLNLGSKQQFTTQVQDLVDTIKRSYSTYSGQMSKFQQTKELNQKLASSYKSNLQVMVDVSKLLASYTQLFEVLKEEMKKMGALIGQNADLTDLSYVSQLTQSQMSQLQTALSEQAGSLQGIYNKYGMGQEAAAVTQLVSAVNETTALATRAMQQGGKHRRKRGGNTHVRSGIHARSSSKCASSKC